jgi:hypothetical protein
MLLQRAPKDKSSHVCENEEFEPEVYLLWAAVMLNNDVESISG